MTNNENLWRRAVDSYGNYGIAHFLSSSLSYLWRIPIYQTTFSTDDTEVTASADILKTDDESVEVEIKYQGTWEAPYPQQIRNTSTNVEITPRDLYKFSNVTLVGSRPFVASEGVMFAPSNIGTSTEKGKLEIQYRDVIKAKMYSEDTGIELGFLLSGNSPEFAHWASEVLTKLKYYENAQEIFNEDIELVVCPGEGGLSTWQEESLELLGCSREEYSVHIGPALQLDELLIPSHKYLGSFSTEYPSPDDLRWVREQATTDQEPEYNNRIYISRRDADRRQVKNESEIRSVLSEFGFETYVPGKLSYSDQVSLFSNANIIVGPHGAGMMNALYSENGTLIELMSDSSPNVHHFCLSNLTDIDYEYVPAQPIVSDDIAPRHYDIVVDPEKLYHVLHDVL